MTSTADSSGIGGPIGQNLGRNWWAIEIRGVLAVLFGIIALFYTDTTMLSLVYLFAFYALADGIFAIVAGVRAMAAHERWGWLLVEGIVGILAAVIAVIWPELSLVAFVALIAGWSIVTGILELGAAYRLDGTSGRGWLAFAGIMSIAFGVLLILAPIAGAVVLTWWLGAYAIVFGISLMTLGFRLRKTR